MTRHVNPHGCGAFPHGIAAPTGLLPFLVLMPLMLASINPASTTATAQAQDPPDLPVVQLDALDPARWSLSALRLAPGQTIQITNRGVQPHTFTVAEWGISVDLPSLEPVTVTVPDDVEAGQTFTFFCSVGDHRRQGQQGTITIVSPEDAIADATPVADDGATTITMSDDFRFTPASLTVEAGTFLQIANAGVLEHHFVVDEWNVNVTVAPGASTVIRVPDTIEAGSTFTFYCSVPGHRDGGMQGTITVTAGSAGPNGTIGRSGMTVPDDDLLALIPEPALLGEGWEKLRDGNARAVSSNLDALDVRIFPGDGRGAAYIGPDGSRAIVVVLPLVVSDVPTNQVSDAMFAVQSALMPDWDTDFSNSAYSTLPNPPGCDLVSRTSGITELYTLPAGSTSCQMRGPGIAIVVAVEGTVNGKSGVAASDEIVRQIIANAA
ncbi:MAG: cupredoxin domain-containing protein [Thermomicrobiales bacterium]